MIVHRGSFQLGNAPVLLQTLRDQLNCLVYPVHRLDQPTSGVILFGLNPSAAASMVDLFTRRQVGKYYQAFVRGWMHREGRLKIPLITGQAEFRSIPESLYVEKQNAITDYTTIRWYEIPDLRSDGLIDQFSLVEAQPRTGRWHQIRRHLKHVAHPIIGDYRHGDDRYTRWFETHLDIHRMLLAACYIEFRHPYSGEWVAIRSNRGEAFDTLLSQLSNREVPIRTDRIPQQPSSQELDDEKFAIRSLKN